MLSRWLERWLAPIIDRRIRKRDEHLLHRLREIGKPTPEKEL